MCRVVPRQGSHLSCTPDLSQPFSAHEQVCYKEAALLRRLRHPSIVELEAIFQSDGRFYLQLPWYANGTLDEWFKATRPSPLALAAVLLQPCRAMSQVSCCRPGSYQS